MAKKEITLLPIAMRRPTMTFTYAPSRFRAEIKITSAEFAQKYAAGETVSVSREPDGKSNPTPTLTYTKNNNALLGRFIRK